MINENEWLVVGLITSPHGINGKPGKETFIISFKGINTRNKANELKQYKILVKSNILPKLNKEEFHLMELVNLEVKILENK